MAPDSKPPTPNGSSRAWEALTPALSEWILNAVSSMGFNKMTPVQASSIPLFMGNKDVVVEAVTGSGKTLAFLIPIVEKLLRLDEPIKKHHIGAIIISPTRELASQIHSVLLSLLGFHPPSIAAIKALSTDDGEYDVEEMDIPVETFSKNTLKILPQLLLGGNQSPAQDLAQFLSNSTNILIGTPGRLLDILSSPHVHCPQSSFEVLVLDEADRLLDLGFKVDLQKILGRLPKQRRTGLFSASVSEAVDQIIRVGLRNPIRISVKVKSASGAVDKRTPASLQMSYLVTKPTQKLPAISQLLGSLDPTPQKSIIYVSTCAAVDYFQHVLPVLLPNFAIIPLHGKQAPNVRQKNFSRFVDSLDPTVLLTTDVAARGLDIPSVDFVVQIDPPSDPKVFLHRCGRAGRAGRRGLAVALITPGREEDYIPFLAVRKTPVSLFAEPRIQVNQQQEEEATARIRELLLTDRAIHDKAQRAFVSWVRAYSKHQASSIFCVQDLDWAELGRGWGLLRLPKMPEVKTWTGDRSLGVSLDFSEYKYKDKAREKHRLEESLKAPVKLIKKEVGKAWSVKSDIKETREVRREKRQTRRENERVGKMTEEELAKKKELDRMIEEVRKTAVMDEDEWGGISS